MAVDPQDRTPEQVQADLDWLAEIREARGLGTASHPDKGKFGGMERRWDDLAAVKPAAEGRAS